MASPFQYMPTPSINPALFVIGAIIVVLAIIYLYLKLSTPRRGKCDLHALVIDDSTHTIRDACFERLAGDVYVNAELPAFLVIPHGTTVYNFGGRKTVLAISKSILAHPIQPSDIASLSLLLASDDYKKLITDDPIKLLSELHKLEDKVKSSITVSPNVKIGLVFDVKNVIAKLYKKPLIEASNSLLHILQLVRQGELYARLVEALTRHAEAKHSWMRYLLYIILIVGVLIIMSSVVGGR
jgi:hypothetical protein